MRTLESEESAIGLEPLFANPVDVNTSMLSLENRSRFSKREAPHRNKKSKIMHVDAKDLVCSSNNYRTSIVAETNQAKGSICLKDAIIAKRTNLLQKLNPLPQPYSD